MTLALALFILAAFLACRRERLPFEWWGQRECLRLAALAAFGIACGIVGGCLL